MVDKILADPKSSSLQNICVNLHCNGGPFGLNDKPFYCDFSPFERLKALTGLTQFRFVVQSANHRPPPYWEHLRFEHNYKHLTYPRFREDSNRLARRLIPRYKYEWEEVNALWVAPAQTVGHRQLRVFAESMS
jgi:hypothetical protein